MKKHWRIWSGYANSTMRRRTPTRSRDSYNARSDGVLYFYVEDVLPGRWGQMNFLMVIPKTPVQLAHCCFVEMAVVIVGNQYQVNRRRFRHGQGWWREPPRPDQAEGAGTVR